MEKEEKGKNKGREEARPKRKHRQKKCNSVWNL